MAMCLHNCIAEMQLIFPQIRNYAPNMIQKRKESASLVKRGHSASNVTIKTYKCPLPHHATWGNTQNHDHKLPVLSKVILEHISISVVAWIDIQYILPWCPDPFCWHRDELEDKRLDAACCFESEPLHVKPRHDEFIEKRTVSLSQMSNDELARALSWRETVG